jgi:WhiB family transcriptional regulator, redox-sensing transcriptional regulator
MTSGTAHAGDWRATAACLHADPDLFFPLSAAGPSRATEAKAICARCAVRHQCLDFAQANAVYGIWGGTTLAERRRVRRRDQRAARARVREGAGQQGRG